MERFISIDMSQLPKKLRNDRSSLYDDYQEARRTGLKGRCPPDFNASPAQGESVHAIETVPHGGMCTPYTRCSYNVFVSINA